MGATLSEIIDIRRELENPLKRFRKTMLDYSDRISCAPWEEAFNAETDRVFMRDIEPAVLELEEAVKSKPYLQALVGRPVSQKPEGFHRAAGNASGRGAVLSLFAADTGEGASAAVGSLRISDA